MDRAIREAAEAGAFDDLPGAGKPLPSSGFGGDDFLARWAAGEEGGTSFLPMSLQLRKEGHDIDARVSTERSEQKVRELVEDLNARISNEIRMPTSTPPLAMRQLNADEVVARWQAERDRLSAERSAALAAERPATVANKRWWRRSG